MQNAQNAGRRLFWILVLAELLGLWRDIHTVEIRSKNCSLTNEGAPGRIVCRFRVDLNFTKDDFSVRRSNVDGTDTVSILDCTWLLYEKPECFVRPRYTVSEETPSNEVVIIIPIYEEEHNGQYSCHVIPENDLLVEHCDFKLATDTKTEYPSTTEITGTEAKMEYPSTTKMKADDGKERLNKNNATGTTAGFVSVGVLFALRELISVFSFSE